MPRGIPNNKTDDDIKEKITPEEPSELMKVLSSISGTLSTLSQRIDNLENSGKTNLKKDAKVEDIEKAGELKKDVSDPRIVKIVEEILGEDFGIEIETYSDKPGFLFSIIVPSRLSDLPVTKRPIIDPDKDGEYKRDAKGVLIEEIYQQKDKRSRAISSIQSYDAIRQHCEKVRAYLVTYYQKMSKPLPEFKIK